METARMDPAPAGSATGQASVGPREEAVGAGVEHLVFDRI
jgi:hypothetical protein